MLRLRALALILIFGLVLPISQLAAERGREALVQNGLGTEALTGPRLRKSPRDDRQKELPPTETIDVGGKVEDLFGTAHFSNKISPLPGFVVDQDPIRAELDLMDRFIARVKKKEIPVAESYLSVTRYHLADQRVLDRIKVAMKAGIPVDVITDLNDSVDVAFEKGETSFNDFRSERMTPNKSPNGRFLQQLIDLGFEYGTTKDRPKFGIYSQPIFRRTDDEGNRVDRMIDIMHEKSIVVGRVANGKVIEAEATAGSANMVAHGASAKAAKDKDILTRVNIVREIKNPDLAKKRLEHVLALRENFAAGKAIDQMPEEKFLRVETKNGWVETGFTNGRNNLNDRIAALLLHATPGMTREAVGHDYDKGTESYYDRLSAEFGGWSIGEIREMQFVNTFGEGREAEKHLFEQNKDVIKLGLYDAKFNEIRGYGFPPIQVGVDLLREMGGTVFGFPKAIADRMKTLVYLRGVPHIQETDLDGPPIARFLLHTKLYMVRGRLRDGTEVQVIFDGSMNKSNHKENAEDQDMIVIKGKSDLADSYWAIPELLAKAEPEHFNEGSLGLYRDVFARMTGRSPLEIDKATGEKLRRLLSLGEHEKLKTELERIAKEPTTLKKHASAKDVKKWIASFHEFLKWHKAEFPNLYGREENFYLNRLLEVPIILSDSSISPGQSAYALKGMMWSPDSTPEQKEARARTAWGKLGMPGAFPELGGIRENEGKGKVASIDGTRLSGENPLWPHDPREKVVEERRLKSRVAAPDCVAPHRKLASGGGRRRAK